MLYPFSTGKKHGLMDATGKPVVMAKYEVTGFAGGDFTYARVHNDHLYFDAAGKKLFQRPIIMGVAFDADGIGATWEWDAEREAGRGALLWPSGKEVLCEADDVWAPREGLAPARDKRDSPNPDGQGWWEGGGSFGYLDLRGKWKIEPKFAACGPFDHGIAPAATRVKGQLRWGVIGKDGAWRTKPAYARAVLAGEGRITMSDGKLWGLIGTDGKVAIKPRSTMPIEFSCGLGSARYGNVGVLIDERGEIVAPPQFEEIGVGIDGAWPYKIGDKWGLLDKSGELVTPPKWWSLMRAGDELFMWSGKYKRKGPIAWGYCTPKGEVIYEGTR